VTEIHTFDQDDLLSEDVMILDTYTEIFAWVGQNADAKEKQQAFDIAQVCVSCGWML
jgi:gelsolin